MFSRNLASFLIRKMYAIYLLIVFQPVITNEKIKCPLLIQQRFAFDTAFYLSTKREVAKGSIFSLLHSCFL